MSARLTALEEIMMDKQRANPGCLDGKLLNFQGEPYSEARHGTNPLGQGYCICAPAKPLRLKSEL